MIIARTSDNVSDNDQKCGDTIHEIDRWCTHNGLQRKGGVPSLIENILSLLAMMRENEGAIACT